MSRSFLRTNTDLQRLKRLRNDLRAHTVNFGPDLRSKCTPKPPKTVYIGIGSSRRPFILPERRCLCDICVINFRRAESSDCYRRCRNRSVQLETNLRTVEALGSTIFNSGFDEHSHYFHSAIADSHKVCHFESEEHKLPSYTLTLPCGDLIWFRNRTYTTPQGWSDAYGRHTILAKKDLFEDSPLTYFGQSRFRQNLNRFRRILPFSEVSKYINYFYRRPLNYVSRYNKLHQKARRSRSIAPIVPERSIPEVDETLFDQDNSGMSSRRSPEPGSSRRLYGGRYKKVRRFSFLAIYAKSFK